MKRFFISFLVTVILGAGLYFLITSFLKNNSEEREEPNNIEENYDFDDSYSTRTTIEELESLISSNEQIIILIGKEKEEATKKVSSILGSIENIDDLNVYYLEKEDQIEKTTAYQNLLTNYPELSNYLNCAPVILVFRNNTLIGGLPGEIEEKNLLNFLEYTEVRKT